MNEYIFIGWVDDCYKNGGQEHSVSGQLVITMSVESQRQAGLQNMLFSIIIL